MSNLFKSKSTTNSETKVDPRFMNQVYSNIDLANQIASRPFEAYTGDRFAGFTQDTQDAFARTREAAGSVNPYTGEAANMLRSIGGYSPATAGSVAGAVPSVSAGQINPTSAARVGDVSAQMLNTNYNPRSMSAANAMDLSLDQYMNPYVNDVINAGLSDLDRSAEQQQTNLAAQAVGSRAFGGSRDAIQRGIAQGEAQRERARFLAESRMAAVNEAMRARELDVARRQEASRANLEAGMRADEFGLNAATANQRALLEAAMGNQRTGAEFSLADQRAAMDAATNNMRAGLEADTANQRATLEGLTADQRAALEASLANQRAGLDYSQMVGNNARTLADLGQIDISNAYNSANALNAIGQQQQALDQQSRDFSYDEFLRRLEYDPQMLGLRTSAMAGMPYDSKTTGTTRSSMSPFSVGATLAGLYMMSDKKMKKSLSPITGALPKLRKIQGSEWEWKDGSGPDAGVIAQDVEKALPAAVAKRGDGMRMVNMPAMVGLLTESVKELDQKVSKKRRGKK